MIVYREQQQTVPVREILSRIEAASDPVERLIEIGELEAGVADALCPERDSEHPVLAALRRTAIRNEPPLAEGLPETVTVSVPEGYAYYAVYPEMYRMAARRFAEEVRPATAVVIGIRSIGTSLSAAVAATLEAAGCEVHSWTVRPRGHPFDRRLVLAPDLARRWTELAAAHFCIVDEGPGLSGSSFASVAGALSELGIPDGRIVLFPSWEPDPSGFISGAARSRWPRHPRYLTHFEELGRFTGARDFSGGKWREHVYETPAEYPAVHPQHERRKYHAEGTLFKFAGLGRYGRRALERARTLAAAGFAPEPEVLDDGFLAARWVPGRPLAPADCCAALLETMARYLAFIRREFPAGRAVAPARLSEMIRLNVHEGLGPRWGERIDALSLPDDAPTCAMDGRMVAHEWLLTPSGYAKADGVDHHDNHFLPGPQDIAWDVAAAAVEFDLDAAGIEFLLARYVALSGDAEIARRLPFYRLAWLAFRFGYSDMATAALGGDDPDAARFRTLRARYAALLRREIGHA